MVKSYVISSDNQVFAYGGSAPNNAGNRIRSYEEFVDAAKDWPGQQLVAIYNAVAEPLGGTSVRKFQNRTVGTKRLWEAIQALPFNDAPQQQQTKKQLVAHLLERSNGASLEEIMDATGWQAHSVRGWISTQKRTYEIERFQRDNQAYAYRKRVSE